ncbi:MAG: TonB-dependent receptor [Niabella sp.]
MKRNLRIAKAKILLILIFMLESSLVFAQTTVVSGKITDENGSALTGVTVAVKNSSVASVSNTEGGYSIKAVTGDMLVFSYVGYIEQEVPVNAQSKISIVMKRANSDMGEVVVIGYQTVLKKDLTGATGVVKMEDARKVSGGSVAEALQGLVPGVTVRNGGAPGQNAAIEIRGAASFNNSTPLYVIDGMIADANVTINPDDVASVQVLKDASAAAIYGARAGNGVIIITTKKGRSGDPVVSVSAKVGMQQLPKVWDVMDAPSFLKTAQQQYTNSGVALPSDIADQLANNTINVDWQKAAYRTSPYQDYNMGVSGGSATGSYYLSGGYYSNKGTVVANSFDRASMRINTEMRKGILTVGENMMLSSSRSKYPGGGVNVFYNSAQMLPIIMVQSDTYKDHNLYPSNPGGWGLGSSNNPTYANNYLANAALDKVNNTYAKIVGNAFASLKLTDWLSYKFNFGLEASFDYSKEVRDTGVWRYTNQPPQTFVSEGRSRFTNMLMEHTLNFNKSFGQHSINGVLGFSRTEQQRDYTNASKNLLQNLNGVLFTTIHSALGTPSADGGLSSKWRNHGWIGRVNYSYADRYLLTLTGRIDQDSRFSRNYRTGYFPSVAGAWRINKEDFFKSDFINDLKLRASYGELGFSDVLGSWPFTAFINSASRAIYGTSQSPQIGQYQSTITNPDLRWETRRQANIGADVTVLNNAVSVSLDWYHSLSKDVLVVVPLPKYLGSSGSPYVNTGSVKNTGIEFTATYRNNQHLFKWDVSGNFTTIKNRVLSVGNQGTDESGNKVDYLEPANYSRTQVGHAMASWFVIQTAGIFQTQDEIDNYRNSTGKIIQPDAKPGDIKYIDLNDDGQINDQDRTFRGSPWPTLQSGLQFNGSYKGFNINLQFVGIFGNKIYDDVRRALDSYQLTNYRSDINPWSSTNTKGTDPRLAVDNGNDKSVSANNMAQTDRWLENGSYIRLRNVEIGYTFDASALKRIGFKSTRVFISGQNIFTITKYKGLDPDVANGNLLTRGMDSGFWPSSRIYSAGVNFEF